jgi:hypothetical protein
LLIQYFLFQLITFPHNNFINVKDTFYDWVHQVKLLISDLKNERMPGASARSKRTKSSKSASSDKPIELGALNEDNEAENDNDEQGGDEDAVAGTATTRTETTSDDPSSTNRASDQQDSSMNLMIGSMLPPNQESENVTTAAAADPAGENGQPQTVRSLVSFEIIGPDTNTEKKFLDGLNLEDANHLTEVEMKATVFNANKTIESLQGDLM